MTWRCRSASPPDCVKSAMQDLLTVEIISEKEKANISMIDEATTHNKIDSILNMELRHQKAKEYSQRMASRRSISRNGLISEAKRLVTREELEEKEIRYNHIINQNRLREFKGELEKATYKDVSTTLPIMSYNLRRCKSSCHGFVQDNENLLKKIDKEIKEYRSMNRFENFKQDRVEREQISKSTELIKVEGNITDHTNLSYDTADHLPSIFLEKNKVTKPEYKVREIKLTINKDREILTNTWIAWRSFISEKRIHEDISKKSLEKVKKIETFVTDINSRNEKPAIKKLKLIKYYTKDSPYLCPTNNSLRYLNIGNKAQRTVPEFGKEPLSLEKIVLKQRAKLKEQEKIITKLKLEQIKLASEKSSQQIKMQIEHSMNEVSLPTKRRLNYLKSTFPSILDRSYYKQKPPFLLQMELRQKERQRRKEEIREKTRQKILQQQKLQEEREIQKKEEIAEQARIEHELKINQLQEDSRMRALSQMAIVFRNQRRLRMAFSVFKKLLAYRKALLLAAEQHCNNQQIIRYFIKWQTYGNHAKEKRFQQARKLHEHFVIKHYWNKWRERCLATKLDLQVADDFNDLLVVERVFTNWHSLAFRRYQALCAELDRAQQHFELKLLSKTFSCWRYLQEASEIEKRSERKKENLRSAVRLILPDFRPAVSFPIYHNTTYFAMD